MSPSYSETSVAAEYQLRRTWWRLAGQLALVVGTILGAVMAATAQVPKRPEARHERVPLGGAIATVSDASPLAFGYPARALTRVERRAFAVGNSLFKNNWVAAPSSTQGRDGLGPLFNARSCSSCHFRDGRGRPPELSDAGGVTGYLVRLGVPADAGCDAPHPQLGAQLQDRSVAGRAEAAFSIRYEMTEGAFADGEGFELLRPVVDVHAVGDSSGRVFEGLRVGARVAPQMVGLGLLEAVTDDALLAMADPDDRDKDGISGRAHEIVRPDGTPGLGRFGWKATQATVRDQTAAAFLGDMGITSSLFPREALTESQRASLGAVSSDGEPEISEHKLGRVAFYSATLAVPAQRDSSSPIVERGERLFTAYGCASCHRPLLETGPEAVIPAFAHQRFRPYTDLLLHDLGSGLADQKHDQQALPSEWRTQPLWGIGLFEAVSGHTRYLHDGRARNLSEAVLWHGGEAHASRTSFVCAPRRDREALLAFLRSL